MQTVFLKDGRKRKEKREKFLQKNEKKQKAQGKEQKTGGIKKKTDTKKEVYVGGNAKI